MAWNKADLFWGVKVDCHAVIHSFFHSSNHTLIPLLSSACTGKNLLLANFNCSFLISLSSDFNNLAWENYRLPSSGIIDSMDVSLSKLRVVVKDGEAWCATDHGVSKSWTRLSGWTATGVSVVKDPPAMREMFTRSLVWKDPLEKEVATDTSILAWEIPRTEKPGRLKFTGSQKSQT